MTGTTFGRAGAGVRSMGTKLLIRGGTAIVLVFGVWWLVASKRVSLPAWAYLACLVIGVGVLRGMLDRLERRSGQMLRGAEAEEAVASELVSLGPDYFVLHDLVIGLGNIDHVVVGPGGIYTIETKSHGGKITLNKGQLRLNGRTPEKNFTNQAYAEAMAVKTYLSRQLGGADYFVQPLLVFTNAFVDVHTPVNGVRILPLRWLLEALAVDGARLSSEERHRIASALHAVTTEPLRSGVTAFRRENPLASRIAAKLVPTGLVLLFGWWLLLGGGLSWAVTWMLEGFTDAPSAVVPATAQVQPAPDLAAAKQHLHDYAPQYYGAVSDLDTPAMVAAANGASDYTWHYVEQTGAAQATVRSVTIRVNADGSWGGLSFGE